MKTGNVVAGSLGLLLMATLCWSAEPSLAQWDVGQGQVTPQDLAVAPVPPAPETLSLRQAVEAALSRNAGFRSTVRELLSAGSNQWAVDQRWSAELTGPVQPIGTDSTGLSAGAGLTYLPITGLSVSVDAQLASLDDGDRTLEATIRQPLWRGSGSASSAYEQVRSARNNYRVTLLNFFMDRQDLIERVISSYFGTIQQQQLVDIQDASVTRAEAAVKDAQLRLELGIGIQLDLLRAQLRLSREQAAAVSQRQSMQDAMDRLLTLLGYQVAGLPKLITPIPYDPQPTDLAQSLTQAATARPELRLAALGIENRYAAIRLARSSARPRLDVFGSVGMPLEGGISTDWTAGVEAQMPLASRALRDDVRQAEWQLPVSLQQLEALREDIAAEVRSQVRAAEAARAKVEIAVVGVEVARQSLRAAQRMVEEGLSTNRDVLDAQDELTSSESSVVTSKISYHLAQIRLRQAVGEDLAKALLAAEEAVGATAPTGEANTP